ncbi:MAG: flagellar basal body-associated FliL family protein [Vampirovibrio sp.]|nr:flagellar basal body-associated FliL family protein [Vampirovibrio sp.]
MARPTKPKDMKPKTEGEGDSPAEALPASDGGGGPGLDIKTIAIIAVISLVSVLGSVGSVFFLAPMVIVPAVVEQLPAGGGEHGEEHGEEHGGGHGSGPTIGLNLELDEFVANLKSDPSLKGNQYVKAKITLNIKVPAEEDCLNLGDEHHASLPAHQTIAINGNGQIVGAAAPIVDEDALLASGGGAPPDPYVGCMTAFTKNMGKYTQILRDIINSALTKRTAGMLASLEGQEALKDEIKEEANALMGPKYEIIRVNFSDFIIQY